MNKKTIYFLLICFFICNNTYAQKLDSINFQKRKNIALYGSLGFTAATHSSLYGLWYSKYPHSNFHFINDNKEWLQMDKMGHGFSAYIMSVTGIELAKWSGLDNKKAAWRGGMLGVIFQTPLEILDGFSSGWGASVGDITANTLGSTLSIGQQLLWSEQRIKLKYFYAPSPYASIRPNLLGNGFHQEFLKDYNGQSYWLSFNLKSFHKKSKIPEWLNLAVGYGASGMVGGDDNIWDNNGIHYDRSDIIRSRRFMISPDIDLSKIKTKSKILKPLLFGLSFIKFPLPGFEINDQGKMRGMWIAR